MRNQPRIPDALPRTQQAAGALPLAELQLDRPPHDVQELVAGMRVELGELAGDVGELRDVRAAAVVQEQPPASATRDGTVAAGSASPSNACWVVPSAAAIRKSERIDGRERPSSSCERNGCDSPVAAASLTSVRPRSRRSARMAPPSRVSASRCA